MKQQTIGIAPKVSWPTVALVVCGTILALLDLTGVVNIQDELWITLLGASGATFGLGYTAPPSPTKQVK